MERILARAGEHYAKFFKRACEQSKSDSASLEAEFNGISVVVTPESNHEAIADQWATEVDRRAEQAEEARAAANAAVKKHIQNAFAIQDACIEAVADIDCQLSANPTNEDRLLLGAIRLLMKSILAAGEIDIDGEVDE